MTFMPIQLPPGIVRGANPDDAPGRWFDGSLIRWRDGVMEPVGGWSGVTPALASMPRRIHQWRRNNNIVMTVVGCDDHLYSDNSGAYTDVAPSALVGLSSSSSLGYGTTSYGTGLYGTARSGTSALVSGREGWSFANWGEDLLAVCSTDGRLLYYTSGSPSTQVKTVGVYSISTISRTSNVTTVTTSTAHNLTSGDAVQIAGVTDATYNNTSAVVTVTSTTAFTYSNSGTDGSSSGGTVRDITVPVGNRGVIVTPERHVMLIGVGGNPRQIGWSSREDFTDWNYTSTTNTAGFLELRSSTPLLSACAVREGTLVWSQDQIFLVRYVGVPFIYGYDVLSSTKLYAPNSFAEFEGKAVWMGSNGFFLYEGGTVRPIPCPLADYLYSNISVEYGPRRAHAFVNGNFSEVWFFYPSTNATECDRYVMWNWKEDWWSMGALDRTAAFSAGVTGNPVMTGTDKRLYRHEDGWNYGTFDYQNNIYVTSSTINMPDAEQNLTVTQLLPSNGGNYNLTNYTFYTKLAPSGAERTFGPYAGRSDGYVDCRVTGRDVRIKVAANATGDWSIGRMRLKVGTAGGRR